MSRDPEQTIDRIAHAFNPVEWKQRSLLIVSAVFVVIAVLTVVQRALVVDSTTGWVITGIHAMIVIVVVPLLIRRAWREWHQAHPDSVVKPR